MRILITESQLKYLILSEGPPDINNPSVPENLLYGYAPVATIDGTMGGEFMMWLYSKFTNVYNKYATGKNWDANTINSIRQEYGKGFGGDVNVGKSWDAYKKYQANQKKFQQSKQQLQQQDRQQLQQQQQKQELQKIANDYQYQQDAKTNQFVAKQDVLDPNKIQGNSYAQFCKTWQKKNPNKPCPEPTQAESAFTSGNWQYYLDWLITIVEWGFPQFAFIKKLYEIGMAIFHFYSGYITTSVTDAVTNFLNGFANIAGVLGKKIIIPKWIQSFIAKIEKLFTGSGLGKIVKSLSSIGENISEKFVNSAKWVQVLVMVIVDLAGDFISWLITSLITYILEPITNYISYYAPNIGKYMTQAIDWLKLINEFIDTGMKIKKVSEVEKIYKEVKGLVIGS
jgi:hypothetical protein